MAKIITVCNQKGGPGKTTITLNLAGALAYRGYKVLAVDGDQQSSLVEIAALAPDHTPYPANVIGLWAAGMKIHQEIKKFYDLYDYIIIDCPPSAESPIAKSALLISDLAIVAFVPAIIDSLSSVKIRDAIEAAQLLNPALQGYILKNRVEENWIVTKEVIDTLNAFNMPILKNQMLKRAAYVESPGIGNSVHKLKSRKEKIEPAINEVEAVTDEILNILNKGE